MKYNAAQTAWNFSYGSKEDYTVNWWSSNSRVYNKFCRWFRWWK
jgi:hypothetical protein